MTHRHVSLIRSRYFKFQMTTIETKDRMKDRSERASLLMVGDGDTVELSVSQQTVLNAYDIVDYWKPMSKLSIEHARSHPPTAMYTTLLKWIASFLVAACVSVISVFVTGCTELLDGARYKAFSPMLSDHPESKGFGFLTWLCVTMSSVVICCGSAGLVYYHPPAGGSGLPHVISFLNGVVVKGMLTTRTLLVKIGSCVLCNSCGIPVGAEAPMIHLGAIVGARIGAWTHFDRFRNDKDTRDFATLGAACGISAAFGAPIGGMLYIMEEVSSHWDHRGTWRMFFSTMITHLVKAVIFNALLSLLGYEALGGLSNHTTILFEDKERNNPIKWTATIPAATVGLVGGVLAAAFTKLNISIQKWRKQVIFPSPRRKFLEPVIVTAIYVTLAVIVPLMLPCEPMSLQGGLTGNQSSVQVTRVVVRVCNDQSYSPLSTISLASSYQAIRNLMSRETQSFLPSSALFVYLLLYGFGACYTAGTGIASGLLVPCIIIGATYGRLLGQTLTALTSLGDSWLDPGVFAIFGAGAFIGGVTRLTFSLTVIMVELCGDLHVLLPMIVAILTARWVCDTLHRTMLYHAYIELDIIPYLPAKIPFMESQVHTARDVMCMKLLTLNVTETHTKLKSVLQTSHNNFPVLNTDGSFLGCISRSDILKVLKHGRDLTSWEEYQSCSPEDPTQSPDQPLEDCLNNGKYSLHNITNLSPWTVQASTSASMTYALFRNMGLRHLIVLDGGDLVGIITRKDFLMH